MKAWLIKMAISIAIRILKRYQEKVSVQDKTEVVKEFARDPNWTERFKPES